MARFASYVVSCGGCKRPSQTPSGAPSIAWRKVDGLWYCRDCARELSDEIDEGDRSDA
jgi:hypothetical protein